MFQPNPAQRFVLEADDLLAQIEEIALEVTEEASDPEAVNELFRAFHTLKGSGAMFGFDEVAAFTHHVENALDKVRSGNLALSRELVELVLASKDLIKRMMEAAQGGCATPAGECGKIIAALNALDGASSHRPETHDRTFRIIFRPERGIMAFGSNLVLLLNELRALGECTIEAHIDQIPQLEELQPEQCYFWWEIVTSTHHDLNAIRDVFIFVEDGSEISIEPLEDGSPSQPIQKIENDGTTITSFPALQNSGTATARSARKGRDSTIRVPSERLDRLVTLVGEMVMNQSRMKQTAALAKHAEFSGSVEELERLVSELRDTVLGIRMMPIGTTFGHFKRLVHDLSLELGKEVNLITEGAETELDKTVLDQLDDPLVHLVRNCVDHGIEPGDLREIAGKPRKGTIHITAEHVGSNVIVTIADDGKGLSTEAIRAKAVEKKLIAPDASLSEKEIFGLVFLPGFSTAEKITSVSGRGVGLDVVKRQIEALSGTVSLQSSPGKGTEISLTLPLTLAIIEGLLVAVGHEQFIIPMSMVTENVELPRAERSRNNGRNVIAVRGELVPYIRLRDLFYTSGGELELEKIVIMRHENQRVGIVVDRVVGTHQTVIQSLGHFYRNIGIVSGSTVMGDGRVALILDLAGLIRHAERELAP